MLNFRVSFFPFFLKPVLGMSQLKSYLHFSDHVVNFFHLVWLSVSVGQLAGYIAQNIINSPEKEVKILLCLLTKLLLLCPVWQIFFASAFFHFSKVSAKELILLNCGVGEDLRVPWTARRSNQSILKEISPGISLEGMMLNLKLQHFGHLMRRVDSLKRLWCWEGLRAGGEGDNRGWDG